MALWTFQVEYDSDARVWWTAQDELGICTEGDSLEQLASKLDVMVPEMVEENRHLLTDEQRRAPHEFRIVAHHEMQRRAAA